MSIVFEHETHVDNTIEEAFEWHERKGAFRRLMPPWELAEEVRADDNLEEGSQRIFRFPNGTYQNVMGRPTHCIQSSSFI